MTIAVLLGEALTTAAVAVVVKATLVCAAAALLASTLRRAAAAVRYTVWLLALGASAAIVLLMPLAPRLDVALPIAPTAPVAQTTTAVWSGAAVTAPATVVAAAPGASPSVSAFTVAAAWVSAHAALLLAMAWLAGALVVLCRSVIGHLAVRRLVGSAHDVAGSIGARVPLQLLLTSAGIRRRVRLLAHDAVAAPLTTGLFRPVLLFPSSVPAWSDERLRVAVLHELAHVARGDYLGRLIATAAESLFWFHPIVWFAASRLRIEAEHAADDRVLADGCPAVSYASHLLELARGARPLTALPAAALQMAHASDLETRLRAMLDFNRSRRPVSSRFQAASVLLSAAVLIPFAGLRTTLVARQAPSSRVQRGDSTFTRRLDARAGGTLLVTLQTGGEVVIRGWDQSAVELHATLGGRDWRHTVVSLQPDGNDVELQSRLDSSAASGSTAHRFEISVPRHFNIAIKSAGGPLTIRGVNGTFRGAITRGGITIDSAQGRAELSTDAGEVTIADSRLAGSVHTAAGGVALTGVTGGVSGSAGDVPTARGVDVADAATSVGVAASGAADDRGDVGTGTARSVWVEEKLKAARVDVQRKQLDAEKDAREADKTAAVRDEEQAVKLKKGAAKEARGIDKTLTGPDSEVVIRKVASDSTYYIIRMRPDTVMMCGAGHPCVVKKERSAGHRDSLRVPE